jgi:hypothetical protein
VFEGQPDYTLAEVVTVPCPKGSLFEGLDPDATTARAKAMKGIPLPTFRKIGYASPTKSDPELSVRRSERISDRSPPAFGI